ncbi:hypothetical protein BST12_29780, partial [Mycobacterium angelicum]
MLAYRTVGAVTAVSRSTARAAVAAGPTYSLAAGLPGGGTPADTTIAAGAADAAGPAVTAGLPIGLSSRFRVGAVVARAAQAAVAAVAAGSAGSAVAG